MKQCASPSETTVMMMMMVIKETRQKHEKSKEARGFKTRREEARKQRLAEEITGEREESKEGQNVKERERES